MDHARSGRGTRPVWFDAGMERALVAQGEIEQGISYGLDHGQLVPYVRAAGRASSSSEGIGFEVLARWKEPRSGIIGPDVFIPVAEDIGLIGRLSEQLDCTKALREAAACELRRDQDFSQHLAVAALPTGGWLQRIVRMFCGTAVPGGAAGGRSHRRILFADIDFARSNRYQPQEPGHPPRARRFRDRLLMAAAHLRSLPFDIIKTDGPSATST